MTKRIHNLTGRRFGRLVALSYVRRHNGHTLWRCACDCGAIHVTRASALVGGRARSCGCLIAPRSLVGQRFGRLVVLEQGERDATKLPAWRCRCDCGVVVTVVGSCLRRGNTRSCGCLRREAARVQLARNCATSRGAVTRDVKRVIDEHPASGEA